MFGTNPIASPRTLADGFLVKKVFYTIQGEGPFAGSPAIFVRFSGCNLRCFFCDTDFQGGEVYSLQDLTMILALTARKNECGLFVFTGGEPMLQAVLDLAHNMHEFWKLSAELGKITLPLLQIQIETAGTIWPDYQCTDEAFDILLGNVLTIVCSPKTPKVHRQIENLCYDWKYIIRAQETITDGLPYMSTQKPQTIAQIFRPLQSENQEERHTIWVQPCDENDAHINKANLEAATQSALKHGYRLSLQLHKIAGVE